MVDRRKRRKAKRKIVKEQIPCIVYLSSNEESSFELAEMKENRQLRYINEYADVHGLIPMKIVRRGCFGPAVRNKLFQDCLYLMKQGKVSALLVANMDAISSGLADAYRKVGMVQEQGCRIISVDEGELRLDIKSVRERVSA
ncbi:Uncharacterised protein [uncultured Clostridium sp.]|nr:Uncharacterised protein [uncultured Clostridium sp.]